MCSNNSGSFLVCPHCDGTREEPGAPYDECYGMALCSICDGNATVSEAVAEEYYRDDEGHWASDPEFPDEDWVQEVMNGDTRLGYAAWVDNQRSMKNL